MGESKPRKKTAISVIILNHNGIRLREAITDCVASLRRQSAEVEIVLVDDSSTDASPELLQQLAQVYGALVTSTSEGRSGVGAARNAGIRAASGELLAFIDNDAVPCDGWLDAVQCCMREHLEAGACASRVMFMDRPEMVNSMGSLLNLQFQGTNAGLNQMDICCDEPAEIMYPTGCGMVLRRSALETIGLFDEGFLNWGADDADIGLRLRRAGWDIVLASEARIHHIHNASHVRYWDTRNRLRMALKYLNWLEIPWFVVRDLRYNVSPGMLLEYVRGWFSCAVHWDGLMGLLAYRQSNRKHGRFWRQFERFLVSGQRLSMVPDNREFSAGSAMLSSVSVGADEAGLLYHGWYWVERYLGRQVRWAIEDASLRGHLDVSVGGVALELVAPRDTTRQDVKIWVCRLDGAFDDRKCLELCVGPLPAWYEVPFPLEPGDYEIILDSANAVYGREPFPRRYGVGWLGFALREE